MRCDRRLGVGLAAAHPAPAGADEHGHVKHVLLISIDGMHALDFANCAKGVASVFFSDPYCPNLAELSDNGVIFTETSTSRPSDSFPA